MSDRTGQLLEALERAEAALRMSAEPAWNRIWIELEQELLGRLMALGPTDDDARWRVSQAIEVARRVRDAVTFEAKTRDQLVRELDLIEGRIKPPIA
ncbi:MAG: hypothetical protein EBR82_35395 [Caulobacteraceae bacterium]|nr:hypothetical protein [Caulobacteraceae bacterium]